MAFAGMDVGTSGCKLVVYDLDGNEIFKASRKYTETGTDGHRELDPDTVIYFVKETLKEAGESCRETIEAMAITSLGESVVCLDAQSRPLLNSMLTGDSRGIEETKDLIETMGADHIFRVTGLPPNELYGLPKYMWINRHTDAVKKAEAIMFYEDFVGYILTGERKVSYSSAARSMAFDINRMEWSEDLLALAGITREQMSEPVKPFTIIGTVLPEIAKELGLNPQMKIVAGGHDQSCAALGSGLIDPSMGECGMGTCEFLFMMLPEAQTSPYMAKNDFPCIPYIVNERYLSSIEVTTCGALKNWIRDELFSDVVKECETRNLNFWEYMDESTRNIRTDVLVIPSFGSAGNPDLSMDARGSITGLTIHTKREELYRAVLEGMNFQMYLAYEKMKNLGTKMETMVCTGGGAASKLDLQMKADIFNMRVLSLVNEEAGTLGCMMMSAIAVGAYGSVEEAIESAVKIKKEYCPDEEMHQYYMKKFEKYKKFYAKMHDFK